MSDAPRLTLPARPSCVLFDLDGTISESGAVIVATLHDTLVEMGFPGLDQVTARAIVGPPLGLTLATLGRTPDEVPEIIPRYRALLRTRLGSTPPYDGMVGLVRDLAAARVPLAIATSKVETMAVEIVEGYGLTEAFVAVCGSGPDEVAGTKAAVVADALVRLRAAGVDVSMPVMVGDRHHDIDGAAEHGIPTIAVTWGYGTPEEWTRAAAVVRTVQELGARLSAGPLSSPAGRFRPGNTT